MSVPFGWFLICYNCLKSQSKLTLLQNPFLSVTPSRLWNFTESGAGKKFFKELSCVQLDLIVLCIFVIWLVQIVAIVRFDRVSFGYRFASKIHLIAVE